VISIYSDEDVDVLIKQLLEAKGFKVLTTLDAKMLGASDMRQMDFATKNSYIFITHNRLDYEKLYTELIIQGIEHPGIIIAARRNVYELARRIARVLSGYTKESIKNQIIYL
jgi:hypothetical protein